MTDLEVENKVSLIENSIFQGRWNINKDWGAITLNVINLWDAARNHSDFFETDHPETCFENFIQEMNWTYVVERICIERAHEKIRMKGRSRCKPYCCIWWISQFMCYPYVWDMIRKDRSEGRVP